MRSNSYATFCLPTGTKYKKDVVSEEKDFWYGSKTITRKTGAWYHLLYERTEDDMIVYKGVYSVYVANTYPMAGNVILQDWTRENFLYVSKDFRRINHITKTRDCGKT